MSTRELHASPVPAISQISFWTELRVAWRIILVGLVGVSVAPIVVFQYAFGGLILPLQFAFGWTRPQVQLAFSFFFAGITVASLVVGWLHRRFGMRRVTVGSLIGAAIVWSLFPFIGPNVWSLYALAFLAPVLSMGTLQLTWFSLVILWFKDNRGLALAAVLCGTALTATVAPSFVTWAIGRWSWKVATASLAVFPLLIAMPLVLFWFKVPSQASSEVKDHVAELPSGESRMTGLRLPQYWIITSAIALATACSLSVISIAVPVLRDKGISAVHAAAIVGSYGIAVLVGRVTAGYLVDRYWAPAVVAVMLLLPAVGCALLTFSSGRDVMIPVLSMMLLGAGTGAELDSAAYLLSRYLGSVEFARLFGVLTSCCSVACMLAPALFSRLYASSGGYTSTLVVSAISFLLASLLLLTLGQYPRR